MFKKAEKLKLKLRLAMFGPSGAGKTYSALRIATGLAKSESGKIALIDTERKSASKYADKFDFDVAQLDNPTVDNTVNFIKGADGYSVLVIDSLSHAWKELLVEVERIAKAKFKGNTWSAWSEGTPIQDELVNAILDFKGHVIVTMRSKTEWATEQDKNGRNRPVRIGLTPEQGKGIEYEFDMLIELNTDHFGSVIKDRTGKYQDSNIEKPDEKFGKDLYKWLNSGIDPVKSTLDAIEKCNSIKSLMSIYATCDKEIFNQIKKEFSDKKDSIINSYAEGIVNEEITLNGLKNQDEIPEKLITEIQECVIDKMQANEQN